MIELIHDPHTMRVPVYNWASDLDPDTRKQVMRLANMPYVHHHVALMPDAHLGIGATIGSVFGAVNAVVPSAVGVDIGCGVCAIRIDSPNAEELIKSEVLANTQQAVFRAIPLGFEGHKTGQAWKSTKPLEGFAYESVYDVLTREIQNEAPAKLGSLGSGNHFIEFQRDEEGFLWIMIHSGSRNIGLKIANFYIKEAQRLTRDPSIPRDLGFLPADSPEGQSYINDMNWALNYALENRMRMMRRILEIFNYAASRAAVPVLFDINSLINIHHNYAIPERHFHRDLWVHRKGATLASRDTVGLVPGSMGTSSYVVRGLGNPDSFQSCSHGAGRALSRHAARAQITSEAMREALGGVRVLHKSDVRDEAPQAYKSITEVMSNQSDLVEIIHELKPVGTIKG